MCPIKGAADHISTVITFFCDPDALVSKNYFFKYLKTKIIGTEYKNNIDYKLFIA
jgi:hypothetical protein